MKLAMIGLFTLVLLASCGRGNRGECEETTSFVDPHTNTTVAIT